MVICLRMPLSSMMNRPLKQRERAVHVSLKTQRPERRSKQWQESPCCPNHCPKHRHGGAFIDILKQKKLQLTPALLFLIFITKHTETAQLHIVKPTCRRSPRPPLGHRSLWRWCAVCQTPGESSWYPDHPVYVECWSFEKIRRKGEGFPRANLTMTAGSTNTKSCNYHAKWEKCESTEAAMTSQPILLNSSAASL